MILSNCKSMLFRNLKLLFFLTPLFFTSVPAQVKHPEWSYNKTIYEVNIRQYTQSGTFKEFEQNLTRLKDLGAGILWLMPVNPIGEKNRKGTMGSYYSVKDYLAVNPEFGTLDEFKSLVNKIHELGMYVIIDWVANHTSWDNNLVSEHPDWYTKDSLGNFVPPVADWSDVIDLNYNNKELWKYMTSALKYWVEECNIDGFRCDVAGMVPTEFWVQARKELDKVKPVFMLAEWDEPVIHSAFDMTYSWELLHTMNQIAKGEKNASDIVKFLNDDATKYQADAFRMRFTSNHDENTWNGTEFERLGDGAEAFAVLTNVIPGMPLIYNGQEIGLNKRLAFFEKDPIDWTVKDDKHTGLYKTLFNFKINSKVLLNGEKGTKAQIISTNDDKNVFALVREKDGEKVFAIFNLSKESTSREIKSSLLEGKYKNLFTNENVTFTANEKFDLKPWEYRVFVSN